VSEKFEANVEEILKGSGKIAEALQLAVAIPADFEAALAKTEGWWGQEGGLDQFATAMGDTHREQNAALLETLLAATNGFSALVNAVAAEANHNQKPQLNAMEDIDAQMATGETKR
jgi:hypothetical protein